MKCRLCGHGLWLAVGVIALVLCGLRESGMDGRLRCAGLNIAAVLPSAASQTDRVEPHPRPTNSSNTVASAPHPHPHSIPASITSLAGRPPSPVARRTLSTSCRCRSLLPSITTSDPSPSRAPAGHVNSALAIPVPVYTSPPTIRSSIVSDSEQDSCRTPSYSLQAWPRRQPLQGHQCWP